MFIRRDDKWLLEISSNDHQSSSSKPEPEKEKVGISNHPMKGYTPEEVLKKKPSSRESSKDGSCSSDERTFYLIKHFIHHSPL